MWKRRKVNESLKRRREAAVLKAKEDAKLENQLKRANEELARAKERISHLEQANEASVAAAAMAASIHPGSRHNSMSSDLEARCEELQAMNKELLLEQAELHKVLANKVEVNAQLAMYITELADELEEVKLFRDALLGEENIGT